jgi:hypothetical protein
LFFKELLVHFGIPTGSSDEAQASRAIRRRVEKQRGSGAAFMTRLRRLDSFLRCQVLVFLGTAEHEAPILR